MRFYARTAVKFCGYILLLLCIKFVVFIVEDLIILNEHHGYLDILLNRRLQPEFIAESMITPTRTIRCGDLYEYDALLVVHTRATGFIRRQEYRQTYGNHSFTHPRKLKVVFLLGQPATSLQQQKIEEEHRLHSDIVQGPFVDSYNNLTFKAVMGFYWMSQFCSNVSLVIKMDDDVIIDVNRFFQEVWPPPVYARDIIYCYLFGLGEVKREGKWAVPKEFYKEYYYPPYCSGALVIIPFHFTDTLFRLSLTEPMITVDDAFIYGIIREKADTMQILHLEQFQLYPKDYKDCVDKFGARCKYFAALLRKSETFIGSLFKLLLKSEKRKASDFMKRTAGHFAQGMGSLMTRE